MGILYVANKGEKDFQDRFNGEDYVFPRGKTVPVPHEAARHIFGYGESNKARALTRLGIIRMVNEVDTIGKDWLAQFVFEEQQMPSPPDLLKAKPPRGQKGLEALMADAVTA